MENNELRSLIFSDKPTKDDQLNFRDYARILADIALTSETPTTIGIFGKWGSGKSSLMMMMDELLKDKNVHTIWFNAWKYDKEDALWRSLILRIMEGLDAKDSEIEEIRRKLYTAISTEEMGKTQINWTEIGKTVTKEGIKAAATVAFPLAGVGAIFANLGKSILNTNSIDEISKAVTRQAIKRNQDRISSIEQFDKLYLDLVKKLLGKKERLIVFIDDLDRCTPLQALLVIEALKAFLGAEKCVYFVACDPRLIRKGFEQKYGSISQEDVSDYLEKIIQINFEMPPLRADDVEKFLTKLGATSETTSITPLLLRGLDGNPRKLKRFLNNLEIQSQLVSLRGLEIEKAVLIKLACISYGWKQVWESAITNPLILSELQKFAVNTDLENSVGINPLVKEIFGNDNRFKLFLAQEPYFSEREVDSYIFLARTTRTDVSTVEDAKASSQAFAFSSAEGSSTPSRPIKLRNPFVFGTIITRSEELIGREEVLNKILSILTSDNSSVISMYGARRMGKSSLLYILKELLNDMDFIPIYVDLQGYPGYVRSSEEFFGRLAYSIQSELTKKSSKKQVLKHNQLTFSEFEEFIDNVNLETSNKPIVLLMDEYEALFEQIYKSRAWQQGMLDFLRSLIMKNQTIRMIFCGKRSLNEISQAFPDQMTSPFSNVAHHIKLSCLSDESSRRLLLSPLSDILDFRPGVINSIVMKTGGHPYLLQGIGFEIFGNFVTNESRKHIELIDLENIFDGILERFNHLFEDYFRVVDPVQQYILHESANHVNEMYEIAPEVLRELRSSNKIGNDLQTHLDRLCELDFLKRKSLENYQFLVPLFADYLKKKHYSYQDLENSSYANRP